MPFKLSNDAKDADFKYGFAKEARPLWNERGCSDHALINLDGALPSPQLMGSQSTYVRPRPSWPITRIEITIGREIKRNGRRE